MRSPRPYLALFLFFILTSLNLESEWLRQMHAELLLAAAVVGLGWREIGDRRLALVCAGLALAPLFSSLANHDYLAVIDNEEYRSWVKALVVAPFVPAVFRDEAARRRLVDLVLLAIAVFGVVFLYRFFVLGEARAYDLRPTLVTKNGDPNFICTFFAVGIPLALERRAPWLAVAFAACAVATESRMGLLSIAASLCVLAFRARRRVVAAGVGVAVVLAGVYGASVWHRFATLDDESSHGRVKSYVNGATLFVESPLFGKGWDASPDSYFRNSGYPLFRTEAHAISVHDTPLQLAADLGLYGLGAYGLLFLLVARSAWAGLRRRDRLASFAAASLLALSLNYLTLPLATKDFGILFLVVLFAISRARERESSPTAGGLCLPSFPPADGPVPAPG